MLSVPDLFYVNYIAAAVGTYISKQRSHSPFVPDLSVSSLGRHNQRANEEAERKIANSEILEHADANKIFRFAVIDSI